MSGEDRNVLICVTGSLISRVKSSDRVNKYGVSVERHLDYDRKRFGYREKDEEKDFVRETSGSSSDSGTDEEFIMSLSKNRTEFVEVTGGRVYDDDDDDGDEKKIAQSSVGRGTKIDELFDVVEGYEYLGSKYAGKTTVADILKNCIMLSNSRCAGGGYQVRRMSFAQPLKKLIVRKMNLDVECLKFKESAVSVGCERVTPRHLMQKIGTNIVRHYDERYWIEKMKLNIEKFLKQSSIVWHLSCELKMPQHILRERFRDLQVPVVRSCVIVDDVRFENELMSLKRMADRCDMKFVHVVLVREKKLAPNEKAVEKNVHASEQTDFYKLSMEDVWGHDFVHLYNNTDRVGLQAKCKTILNMFNIV